MAVLLKVVIYEIAKILTLILLKRDKNGIRNLQFSPDGQRSKGIRRKDGSLCIALVILRIHSITNT